MDSFEKLILELTKEINGQYPRPWMTDSIYPETAKVFIVGYNPASAYPVKNVDHNRHIDALFNRNGEQCRKFYSEVTQQSPTRTNIEWFSQKLVRAGITGILETNVVCYGAKKKKYLSLPGHRGGRERGIEIFRLLVKTIKPKAIILHGAGVRDEFARNYRDVEIPKPPSSEDQYVTVSLNSDTEIFVIPSLALPGFQNWPSRPLSAFCNWADGYLDQVAKKVATLCAS
jgi:hypothetical protein